MARAGERLEVRQVVAPRPDLRHTCASLLIASGVHAKAIQVRLGHSTFQMTMDVYGHLLRDLDAIERDEGGKEYWVSHGGYYEVAGLHVHATMWGPLGRGPRSPVEFIGVQALINGHQYMAISAVSCALIAEDNGLKEKIETRYESVAAAQRSENERVTRR